MQMRRHVPSDYLKGPLTNPAARPGDLDAKAPYRDFGTERPDPTTHYSPAAAQLEWERVWTKVWTLAGLENDVPQVGDYFKYDLGYESFIIVRTSSDRIQAFYNVCHHRGNQLITEEFGRVGKCFRCAFHGWEYGLDGKLEKIRDEEIFKPALIADRPGLTPVRCDVWNGLIFISMNDAVEPLTQFLGVIPQHLGGYPFGRFKVLRDVQYHWKANWKVALEAFLEIYHGADVHPQLMAFADPYNAQYDVFDQGVSRMIIPRGYVPASWGDTKEINEGLRNQILSFGGNPKDYGGVRGGDFKPYYSKLKRAWGLTNGLDYFNQLSDGQIGDNWNYFIFPNVTLNVFSDALLIQRFRPDPDDPCSSVYDAVTLNVPVPDTNYKVQDLANLSPKGNVGPSKFTGDVRPARLHAKTYEELGSVLAQDALLIPHVQRGIRSRAFSGYRLSEQEARIWNFLKELDRYLYSTT
jgi:phenylpropionate dioxygenase-like ring-hydroxylating dioxygenase large terminal subunit